MKNSLFYKKSAHGLADHFARAEKVVRVEFDGQTIEILFAT